MITNLAQYFDHYVSVTITTDDSTTETIDGRVKAINDTSIVIQSHGDARVVELGRIIDIMKARRRRITQRHVRVLERDDSAKQHLADRHGTSVSVLNAVDEATAALMHSRIDHADLGHTHGEKVRAATDPELIAERVALLEEVSSP